jgi:hypothetical protein
VVDDSRYNDRGYQRPTAFSTSCQVFISMRYSEGSNFIIESAEITMPEIAKANPYFHAVLTNISFGPSKQTFDPPDFTIEEAKPGHQILRQKHLAGNYGSAYGSGELSLDTQKLSITSQGPYKGTYPDGDGAAYTSQRDFDFSWNGGVLKLNQISFWAYGNAVTHATDAECKNIILRKVN